MRRLSAGGCTLCTAWQIASPGAGALPRRAPDARPATEPSVPIGQVRARFGELLLGVVEARTRLLDGRLCA